MHVKKRILSLLLVVCMIPSLFMFTASASFGGEWRLWSQACSDYANMRAYGCHVTAEAKLLAEAGIIDPATFDPDDLYDWLLAKNYIESDCSEINGGDNTGTGMIAYAQDAGRMVERVGAIDLSGLTAAERVNVVWTYILHGCSVILHCAAHQDYISRVDSLVWGRPVISRSVSDSPNYGESTLIRAYQGYAETYKESAFDRAYIFRVGNPDPDNAAHSYVLTGTTDPTCTEPGSEIYQCSVCHAVKTVAVGAARGHRWDDGTVVDSGSKTFTHEYTYKNVDFVNYYETRHKTCTRCQATTDSTRYYGACGANATWSLENGVLTISGTGATESYNCRANGNAPNIYPPWSEERQPVDKIVIENGITSIGTEFFWVGNKNNWGGTADIKQTKIVIPDSVTSIGWGAFSGCQTDEFVIGKNVTSIGKGNALGYVTDKITVAKENTAYRALNGVLYTRDLKTLLRAPTGRTGACRIADTTEVIYDSAFENAQFDQITIPDSVKTIGDNAFVNVKNLRAMDIPDSVKSIGGCAFSSTSLLSISVPACTIEYGAFDDNAELNMIIFRDGVTELPEHGVAFCPKLKVVQLPSTLKRTGNYTFFLSPMTDVFFTGSEEQWKSIRWGTEVLTDANNNDRSWSDVNIHYNAEVKSVGSSGVIHGGDGTSFAYPLGSADIFADVVSQLSVEETKLTLSDRIAAALADCMTKPLDISLRDADNNEVQPQNGGMVMVNIPVPEGFGADCTVYRLESDGTLTNMCATEENGMLQFAAEHFCTFIVAAPCEHDYKAAQIAPTCISQGYTQHTCQLCGKTYQDAYVPAISHNYVNGVCSMCGGKDSSYVQPTDPEPSHPEPTQSAGLLDTTSHNAYVSGRSATTFAPTGTLSRAEAAQLLYELMTEQAHKQYDRSDNDFSDVPAGQWYTVAVSTLANVGAITGCGDGTFQPRKSISRAEFVTILTGIYGEDTTKGMPFSDVDRSWYYDAVATAYANGWVSGYTDGTFRPNQTITRAEAVVILNSVLGRSCDLTYVQANAQAALHFTDITPGAWYYANVIEASVAHTYTKQDDGTERWTALA